MENSNQLFSDNNSVKRLEEVKKYFLNGLKLKNGFTIKKVEDGKACFEVIFKPPYDNHNQRYNRMDESFSLNVKLTANSKYIKGIYQKYAFNFCEVVDDCEAINSTSATYEFLVGNEDKLQKVLTVLNSILEKIGDKQNV